MFSSDIAPSLRLLLNLCPGRPTMRAILSRDPALGSQGRMTRSRNNCCGSLLLLLLLLMVLLLMLLLIVVFNLQRNNTDRPVCISRLPHPSPSRNSRRGYIVANCLKNLFSNEC